MEKKSMKRIDLGGGMRIEYWQDENMAWHMKSNVTDKHFVSDEKFTEDIFFSDIKFANWLSKAKEVVE